MKSVTVVLGETEYEIQPLNVGEFERIAELMSGDVSRGKLPFAIFRIAMERASPHVEDVNALVASPSQIGKMVDAIMSASGMASSGEATPATGA